MSAPNKLRFYIGTGLAIALAGASPAFFGIKASRQELLADTEFVGAAPGDANARKAAIVLKADASGRTLPPAVINMAYSGIRTAPTADLQGVTISGLQARVLRECVRIEGRQLVLRNIHCSMIGDPQRSMRELPEGLHIDGGSDIIVENSSFSGFQMTLGASDYWNGDGVAIERGVTQLEIRDVIADNNTDAGFDIKSPVTMDKVSASGNCRNYRLWSEADIGTMRVGDVTHRGGISGCFGIWIKGGPAAAPHKITIKNLVVDASRPLEIIRVDGGAAEIFIRHCAIRAPSGTHLIDQDQPLTRIVADPSCRLR